MLDIDLYKNSNTIEDIKNYLTTQYDNNLHKKINFLIDQMQIKSSTFRDNLDEYYSNYHLSVLCEYYLSKYWIPLSEQHDTIINLLNDN